MSLSLSSVARALSFLSDVRPSSATMYFARARVTVANETNDYVASLARAIGLGVIKSLTSSGSRERRNIAGKRER